MTGEQTAYPVARMLANRAELAQIVDVPAISALHAERLHRAARKDFAALALRGCRIVEGR